MKVLWVEWVGKTTTVGVRVGHKLNQQNLHPLKYRQQIPLKWEKRKGWILRTFQFKPKLFYVRTHCSFWSTKHQIEVSCDIVFLFREGWQKNFIFHSRFWSLRGWWGLSESIKKGKFVVKIFFSDYVEWSSENLWKMMSADVKANIISGGCILQIYFNSVFLLILVGIPSILILSIKNGGREVLLNRQNLLSMTKVICWQPLRVQLCILAVGGTFSFVSDGYKFAKDYEKENVTLILPNYKMYGLWENRKKW